MFLKINGSYLSPKRTKIGFTTSMFDAMEFSGFKLNHIISTGELYQIIKTQIENGLQTPTEILLEYPDTTKDVTIEFIKRMVTPVEKYYFSIEKILNNSIKKNIVIEKFIRISEKNQLFSDYKNKMIIFYKNLHDILQSETHICRYGKLDHFVGLIKGIESDFSIFKLAFSDVYNFEVLNIKTKEELEQEINFLRNIR